MGRGLSPLQKSILRLTLEIEENKPRFSIDDEVGRVVKVEGIFRHELLISLFGLPRKPAPRPRFWQGLILEPRLGSAAIDRRKVDAGRCNRAFASLSRALRRLQERGLLERGRWWVFLTAEGRELARQMKAENSAGSAEFSARS